MPSAASGAALEADSSSGQEPQPVAAGKSAMPQEGESQDGTPPGGATGPSTALPLDPAVLLRERDEAKREAANARRELNKREAAEREAAAAAMSDAEKVVAERDALKAERDKWETEKRRLLADAEARDLGAKLGLVDHRDALALIPADQIEIDETTGRPKNLETLFRALIAEKPYLVAKPGATPPPSTGAAAGTSGGPAPRLTADELEAARTTGIAPERYAALKSVKTLDDWQKTRPVKAN